MNSLLLLPLPPLIVDVSYPSNGRVLINAQIAAGLCAYFAVTSSLVLVLLLTVVQKIAIDGWTL
jgi:hypothetical protein